MAGHIGFGAAMSVDVADGSSYAALTDLIDIELPEAMVTIVQKKTFDAATRWIAKVPALVDGKQIAATALDDGSLYGTYRTLAITPTRVAWKFTWSGGTKNITGHAYVANVQPGTKIEELDTTKITLEVDGAITYATN